MGQNARQDSNFMQCSGKLFFSSAVLVNDETAQSKSFSMMLDMQCIERIQYENTLNDFLMRGTILYRDQFGVIDRFIDRQNVRCVFAIAQIPKKSDSGIDSIDLQKVKQLAQSYIEHDFIVEKIRPVGRSADVISYEIDLVSSLWKNCTANIACTTFDDKPKNVIQILKECMTAADLKLDKDSFDAAQSNVQINFITRADDNVLTIYKHLMNKLYFYKKKAESLKMIAYDAIRRQHKIIDLSQMDGIQFTVAAISFFKSSVEGLMQEKPINIGSYTNGVKHTDSYAAMLDRDMFEYDIKSNKIANSLSVDSDSTVSLMNSTAFQGKDGLIAKYASIKDVLSQSSFNVSEDSTSNLKHFKSSSTWIACNGQYSDIIDSITSDNAIVLDTDVDIRRQPGTCVEVVVDRSLNLLDSDSAKALKAFMMRYKVFEGSWIISKAITTIEPNAKIPITQKLALFRNFTVDLQLESPLS